MYAVFSASGKQYKVKKGDTIRLDLMEDAIGSTKEFSEVLLVGEGAGVQVGRPFVSGAAVHVEILGVEKGPKIEIVHRKRRKQFKRHVGHRQPHSRVLITGLTVGSTKDLLSKEERAGILSRVGFVRKNEYDAVDQSAESQAKQVEKQKARAAKSKARVEARAASPVKKKAKAGAKKPAAKKKSSAKKPAKKADAKGE